MNGQTFFIWASACSIVLGPIVIAAWNDPLRRPRLLTLQSPQAITVTCASDGTIATPDGFPASGSSSQASSEIILNPLPGFATPTFPSLWAASSVDSGITFASLATPVLRGPGAVPAASLAAGNTGAIAPGGSVDIITSAQGVIILHAALTTPGTDGAFFRRRGSYMDLLKPAFRASAAGTEGWTTELSLTLNSPQDSITYTYGFIAFLGSPSFDYEIFTGRPNSARTE